MSTPRTAVIDPAIIEAVETAIDRAADRLVARLTERHPAPLGPQGCVVCDAAPTTEVGWPPASLRAILTPKEWDGQAIKVQACARHAQHPTRWPRSVTVPLWDRMAPTDGGSEAPA